MRELEIKGFREEDFLIQNASLSLILSVIDK